jgi:hypothetical protein
MIADSIIIAEESRECDPLHILLVSMMTQTEMMGLTDRLA